MSLFSSYEEVLDEVVNGHQLGAPRKGKVSNPTIAYRTEGPLLFHFDPSDPKHDEEEECVRYEDDESFSDDSEDERNREEKKRDIELFTDHHVAAPSELVDWLQQHSTAFAHWVDHTSFVERNHHLRYYISGLERWVLWNLYYSDDEEKVQVLGKMMDTAVLLLERRNYQVVFDMMSALRKPLAANIVDGCSNCKAFLSTSEDAARLTAFTSPDGGYAAYHNACAEDREKGRSFLPSYGVMNIQIIPPLEHFLFKMDAKDSDRPEIGAELAKKFVGFFDDVSMWLNDHKEMSPATVKVYPIHNTIFKMITMQPEPDDI